MTGLVVALIVVCALLASMGILELLLRLDRFDLPEIDEREAEDTVRPHGNVVILDQHRRAG